MAKQHIEVNFDQDFESLRELNQRWTLSEKVFFEFSSVYQALRVWKSHFAIAGDLKGAVIHSPPHDPPDVVLEFESGQLSVEHTQFLPESRGRLRSIHRSQFPNSAIFVPAVSKKFRKNKDLVKAMFEPLHNPPSPIDEAAAFCDILTDAVDNKLAAHEPDLLVVTDSVPLMEDFATVALVLIYRLRSSELRSSSKTSILFHSELDPWQRRYSSWLISQQGKDVRYRDSKGVTCENLEEYTSRPFYEIRRWYR
jgi:hypothetical protein